MITDVSSAGDTITIHGFGFAEAESTCTLTQNSSHGQLVGTIPAVKTFDPYGLQSSTQLTCSLPSGFGSFSAGAPVQVTLSGEDGEFVQMKPHVLSGDDSEHDTSTSETGIYITETLHAVMPSTAGALGGTLLYFFGTGFAFGKGRGAVAYRYIARFGDFVSPQLCKALNVSVVVCRSPIWPYAGTDVMDVRLSRTWHESSDHEEQPQGLVSGQVSFTIYAEISRIAPLSAGALSGANVSIFGRGFKPVSHRYFCRWKVSLYPFFPYHKVEADVVNASLVTCAIQQHPLADSAKQRCKCGACDSCITHGNVSAEYEQCLFFCAITNASNDYWEFPAAASTFSVQEDPIAGEDQVGRQPTEVPSAHSMDFETFAQVRSCEPTTSGAGLSHVITIFGAGFNPFRKYPSYYCSVFDGKGDEIRESALTHAADTTRIVCDMPPYLLATRVNITLHQLNPNHSETGNRQGSTEIPDELLQTRSYLYYPQILSIEPSRAPAVMGTAAVNISVIGVVPTSDLVLRFSREDGEKFFYSDSTVLRSLGSILSLNAPIWDSEWGAGSVNVTLVLDKEVIKSAGTLHFQYDETLSSIQTRTGKASGGFVGLFGYAFIPKEIIYYCTVSSVANSSRSVRGEVSFANRHNFLTCSYADWPYSGGFVDVRVWRGEREIALMADRPLTFEILPVWWGRLLDRKLDYSGGKLVAIDGFGFVASPDLSTPTFKCVWQSLTELDATGEDKYSVSTPGFGVSPSLMYCVSPLWLAKAADSRLFVYECEMPATSSHIPGSIDGLLCERQVQRIGPWYGVISFEDGPMVLPETTPNAPIRGDFTITLSGRNFAYQDMSPLARIGDSECEFTRWISWSTILCGVPAMGTPMVGNGGDFIVTVAATRLGSRSQGFSYDGPAVRDFGNVCASWRVGHANCSHTSMKQGSNLALFTSSQLNFTRRLYFSGKDMAVADVTLGTRVGGSACEQTLWLSSSWVLCKHSMGIGASRAASVITVQYSQKLGTITTAFSMDKIAMSGVSGEHLNVIPKSRCLSALHFFCLVF